MPLPTLALFLITLPILEFVGSLIYVYIKDPLVFAIDFRIAAFTFPALIFYQFCTWFFVRGLICPTQIDSSYVPVIIFGITAFIYTVYIIMYWYFFTWFQASKFGVAMQLQKLWPKKVEVPAATVAPAAATSSPAPSSPAPSSPASSTPITGSG
jgi:hypothetical protein